MNPAREESAAEARATVRRVHFIAGRAFVAAATRVAVRKWFAVAARTTGRPSLVSDFAQRYFSKRIK